MDKVRKAIQALLELKDLPEGKELSGFTDEQLANAVEKARASFDQAKESRDIEAASSARDVIKAVREEVGRREVQAAELAEKFAELESDLEEPEANNDEEGEEDKGEGEGEGEGDGTDESEPARSEVVAEETPVIEPPAAEAPPATEPAEATPVAASAKKPVPKPKGRPANKPQVTIIASADSGFSAGTHLSVDQLAQAWVNKAEAVSGARGLSPQLGVAKLKVDLPADRQLDSRNPPEANSAIIDKVIAQAQVDTANTLARLRTTRDPDEMVTLTAAGGLCAPTPVRYEILEIGEDNRPLRDSLPRFGATRGGLRYIDGDTIPYMEDVQAALGHFTEAQDTTGDDYPKPCLRIDCPTWIETLVEADTLCMIVGMWQRLTYPENFRAWWRQAFVAKARNSETRLWDKMVALSTAVTAGEGLGATSDTLSQVDRAAVQLRWRYRISPSTPLRLWAPDFLKAIMRTDLARRQAGDGLDVLAVSDAELARYFAARNIAVTYVLDGQSPGGTSGDIQGVGALNPWPGTVETILAVEGTFLFFEMDGLNFGTEIRDFDMIRDNDVGAFLETFENVGRVGVKPYALTLDICPNGHTAGPEADFNPCVIGS